MQKLLILCFLVSMLSSCMSAYRDHFLAEHKKISNELYFSTLSGERLLTLPDKTVKNHIIESIQNAKKRIWIEIYLWTDKDILTAVMDAQSRGVDVRVILEGNVYSLPHSNKNVLDALTSVGVPIVYADNYQYTFTHAKFWIVDDTYSISTGNWTKSFFEGNRDFIIEGTDIETREFLLELFQRDHAHEALWASIPPHMVISPFARAKITSLISWARSEIDVFVQALSDPSLVAALIDRQQAWVRVRICTALNEENRAVASGSVLNWHFLKKPYLHAKSIMVDGSKIWIGSQNLSTTALDKNREVGILFTDSGGFFSHMADIFKKDCQF